MDISKEDLDNLNHLTDLLHLFHHRNKNQHRRSIWWRHFSLLRKQLNLITHDLEKIHEKPTTHLERQKKKAQDPQRRARIEQRQGFWQDILVPKWQHAFSQVTADGRFSVLGLVLLSVLAEACTILKVTAAFDELGQAEVEKVLERFAEEGWDDADGDQITDKGVGEDVGEVITRDDGDPTDPIPDAEADILTPKRPSPSRTTAEPLPQAKELRGTKRPTPQPVKSTAKKKRKKGGNAIDDLFSGLG